MTRSILIVGAGTTGLTAAVELARLGIDARLIEQRKGPSPLSRAVGIQAASMEIFARSGTRAAVEDEAIAFAGVVFHKGARPIAEFPLNFDDRSRIWGLAQDRTEHHLAETLRRLGGRVEYGTALETLAQDGGGVQVRAGGKEARYDLVIGADGTHSLVRAQLGLEFGGYDLPGRWSIADVDAPEWRRPDHFQGFLLDGGSVAVVVPLETARFRVIASLPDALAALPVAMPVTSVRRTGNFGISVRQVDAYRAGRVYLAGDAAHCHSPVGGRGMNLGIADAADLAARIAGGGLEGYHAARHREGRHVLELSERARRMVQSRGTIPRMGVAALLWGVSRIPPLQRAAMRELVSG